MFGEDPLQPGLVGLGQRFFRYAFLGEEMAFAEDGVLGDDGLDVGDRPLQLRCCRGMGLVGLLLERLVGMDLPVAGQPTQLLLPFVPSG